MANMDNPSSWDKIQMSVQETERLLGQKKYNLAMIKARQTIEYMIRLQCDKAGIVQSTPDNMVRELYSGKWLSKSAAEHYLQVLAIGNQATKENDNSPSNANNAYHILSQEVYAFAKDDKPARAKRPAPAPVRKSTSPSSRGAAARGTAPRDVSSDSNRSRKRRSVPEFAAADLLKFMIPVVLLILLIFIIRIATPSKEPTEETTPAPTTPEVTTEAVTEATTEAATEAPSYKTTTTLNVRSDPSTDNDRIGKLDPGASVNYLRDYDDSWAVILYNGQEAYVSKQYLIQE